MPSDFLNLSSEPEASASTQILSPGKPIANKCSGLTADSWDQNLWVWVSGASIFQSSSHSCSGLGSPVWYWGVSDGSLPSQGSDPAATIKRLNPAPCRCLQIKFYWNTATLIFFVAAYRHSGMDDRPEIFSIWPSKKCFYNSEISSCSGC